MYELDPSCTSSLSDVHAALKQFLNDYNVFVDQHLNINKAVVDSFLDKEQLQARLRQCIASAMRMISSKHV